MTWSGKTVRSPVSLGAHLSGFSSHMKETLTDSKNQVMDISPNMWIYKVIMR